eukprot:265402-Amphidinium_carterae.2
MVLICLQAGTSTRAHNDCRTVEPNPENVQLAESVLRHAGLEQRVTVLTGTLEDEACKHCPHTQFVKLDFIFLDHLRTLYLRDIRLLEDAGFVVAGTIIAADNVGGPAGASPAKRPHPRLMAEQFAQYMQDNERHDLVHVGAVAFTASHHRCTVLSALRYACLHCHGGGDGLLVSEALSGHAGAQFITEIKLSWVSQEWARRYAHGRSWANVLRSREPASTGGKVVAADIERRRREAAEARRARRTLAKCKRWLQMGMPTLTL